MLTAQRLREVLNYDPKTGVFTWIKDAGGGERIKAGSVAGWEDKRGYINIGVDGYKYRATGWRVCT